MTRKKTPPQANCAMCGCPLFLLFRDGGRAEARKNCASCTEKFKEAATARKSSAKVYRAPRHTPTDPAHTKIDLFLQGRTKSGSYVRQPKD